MVCMSPDMNRGTIIKTVPCSLLRAN